MFAAVQLLPGSPSLHCAQRLRMLRSTRCKIFRSTALEQHKDLRDASIRRGTPKGCMAEQELTSLAKDPLEVLTSLSHP